ncbi:MAG: GMC family oxidoreductase [Candidatus Puniceispirillales bacterium]
MECDFIIVGAGSAGCVIANRLSADPNTRVVLIEAGGRDRYPWIHIPVGYFKTMGNPSTDWCYRTEPDPGLNGRSINWPRGKVLGGSSSINGLLYVRGQPQDFDHWRQLGNEGWGWNDVLPLFQRSENWEGQKLAERGVGGPLNVAENAVNREVIDAWLRAAVAAGYPWTDDYNAENQEGIGYFQMTMKNGQRCSSAAAYLKPVMHRKNLEVIVNAHTENLIIEAGEARGVCFRQNGQMREIRARCEVILSAGAIGSPQLLMLSGVGDGEALQQHGIDVKCHLPGVGRNLQDHLQARPVYKCRSSTINTEIRSLARLVGMAVQYSVKRTGPMAMAASLGTGFIKTSPAASTPDIQFHIQPFSADSPAEGAHRFSAFTASVLQLRPESTGEIRLRSRNPQDHPLIYPNYLATQKDCDTLVEGIKITRRICGHDPVKSLIVDEHAPGRAVACDDDEAILDWARNTSTTIYHPTGTCKMGKDGMAVVDPRLRVRGINRLRVADASIMPTITSGNTNAPCIMIGEKLSDMLLEDAG